MTDPKYEPFPTLLSKSDAMLYAASQLEKMIENLELASIFKEILSTPGVKDLASEDAKKSIEGLKVLTSGIVDKDIQIAALRDAATEIRALAHENKLAEARAASHGIAAKKPTA